MVRAFNGSDITQEAVTCTRAITPDTESSNKCLPAHLRNSSTYQDEVEKRFASIRHSLPLSRELSSGGICAQVPRTIAVARRHGGSTEGELSDTEGRAAYQAAHIPYVSGAHLWARLSN